MADREIAIFARQMAERIGGIADEVVHSFSLASPKERVEKLKGVATELLVDTSPVVAWYAVRNSFGTA